MANNLSKKDEQPSLPELVTEDLRLKTILGFQIDSMRASGDKTFEQINKLREESGRPTLTWEEATRKIR